VIECRARRVLFGINEYEFRTLRAGLAIPEAVLLGDPVGNDIRDIDTMSQVPRQKLLGALVVLACPLSQNRR